jgi:molecular chaperone GrpE
MNEADPMNEEPEIEILSSAPEKFDDAAGAQGAKAAEPGTAVELEGDLVEVGEDWKGRYEETREKMIWLAAEFDNFKKRVLKDREENLKFANSSILKEFLVVADNLERALGAMPAGETAVSAGSLKQGVELTLRSFQTVLQKHGVTRIAAKGELFNPRMHEVMFEEKTDQAPDETVLEELQAGYLLHERVLRPAMVKIARNPQTS